MPLSSDAQSLIGAALVKARSEGYVLMGLWSHAEDPEEPLYTFSSNDMNPHNFAATLLSAVEVLRNIEGNVESYDIEETPNLELNGAN